MTNMTSLPLSNPVPPSLRDMRALFQQFPIRNALRAELGWTHYRLPLRVDSADARQWYGDERPPLKIGARG